MSKRNDFSLAEKRELLKEFYSFPKLSQREAAARLGIPQSTFSRLLKDKDIILSETNENLNRKRKRVGKSKDVEMALLEWFKSAKLANAPLSRTILRSKAVELAKKFEIDNFSATDGWFSRWKNRHNVVYRKQNSEKVYAHMPAEDICVNPDFSQDYTPDNKFNTDESRRFYPTLPDRLIMLKNNSDDNTLDVILSSKEETKNEDDEASLPPPTASESRNALQILRRTLEKRGGSSEDYDLFEKLERKIYKLIDDSSV